MNTQGCAAVRPAEKIPLQLNLNQRLNEGWGTLFFSAPSAITGRPTRKAANTSWGTPTIWGASATPVSASRVRNSQREEETRYYLSFSLPLSVFDNNAYLSTGLSATDSHYRQSTVGLSGSWSPTV
ncbi:fimbria/pilus outer membrane usher protein [Serratia ureilytica]